MSAIPIQGHVAVGVDGSPASLAALRWAAQEATLRRSALHIVYGFARPIPVAPARWPDVSLYREARELIDATAAAAQRLAPKIPVTGEVANATAGTALLDESSRAAVVVVGTRGTDGFAGLLLGSVSGQLATHAQCPVVTVPPNHHPDPSTRRRVVVGVDGSEVANLAVRFALEEAALRRATVTAVRAFTPHGPEMAELEEQRLAQALARWKPAFPRVRVELHTTPDQPVPALVAAAEDAQLLVVGSRGLGSFRGLLSGSVGLRLLHHARCPIAVVHPHQHDAGALRQRKLVAAG
jgi:nucleotide-binding universal stress UspA family protein